jgi:hypothetical protein
MNRVPFSKRRLHSQLTVQTVIASTRNGVSCNCLSNQSNIMSLQLCRRLAASSLDKGCCNEQHRNSRHLMQNFTLRLTVT